MGGNNSSTMPANQRRFIEVFPIGGFLRHLPGSQALTRSKDRLVSNKIRADLDRLIKPYGSMLDFHLDTQTRSISFTVDLKGELAPIKIALHDYVLLVENSRTFLQIDGSKIETSREWLTTLLREKLATQKIPVPEHVAWLVKLLS
jgi:hypothetical protein